MNKNFLFFCLFINFLSFGQLSEEKNKLIQTLAKIDYAESSEVGYGGESSKIYYSFEKIKNNLTNSDLLILSKNSSNSLRFYSCMELIHRNEPFMVSIYEYYMQFPLKMKYTQGCIGENVYLSDMIYKEYEQTIDLLNYAEKQLKELPKSDPIYKEWEKVLENSKKLVNDPDFIEAFSKIKKIKSDYDLIKQ